MMDHGTARRWVLGGYLLMLAVVLLSPLEPHLEAGFLAERVEHFFSPGVLTTGDMVDAARNVLLLAGWGLLEVLTDDGRSGEDRVRVALIGGAAIGLTAEVAQLAIPPRIPSLLDAAMNSAGAGLGALVTHAALRTLSRGHGGSTALGVPASALAAPYGLAVLVEATFPVIRPAAEELTSGGPLTRAVWAVQNLSLESVAVIPAVEFVLFLPAGLLLAAAFLESDAVEREPRRRAFRRAAAVGLAIVVAGQLARAPLGMPLQVGPVLVHAASFLVGAWAGIRLVPGRTPDGQEGAGRRAFLVGYVLLLALWRLRPFAPHLDPSAIAGELTLSNWSPLFILETRGDLYSAADILRTFLLFVPLGAVLSAGGRDNAGTSDASDGRALAWILGLALILELGQAVVAARLFDGTDLVVMAAGGTVAWTVVRKAAG